MLIRSRNLCLVGCLLFHNLKWSSTRSHLEDEQAAEFPFFPPHTNTQHAFAFLIKWQHLTFHSKEHSWMVLLFINTSFFTKHRNQSINSNTKMLITCQLTSHFGLLIRAVNVLSHHHNHSQMKKDLSHTHTDTNNNQPYLKLWIGVQIMPIQYLSHMKQIL